MGDLVKVRASWGGCGLGCLSLVAVCGLVGWAFFDLEDLRAVVRFAVYVVLGLVAVVPVGIGLWVGGVYLLDSWDAWRHRRARRRAWARDAKEQRL